MGSLTYVTITLREWLGEGCPIPLRALIPQICQISCSHHALECDLLALTGPIW